MRLEILETVILFFGGTYLTGLTVNKLIRQKESAPFCTILAGVMTWWAIMEVIMVPMAIMRWSYTIFIWLYSIILILLMVMAVRSYRQIKSDVLGTAKSWYRYVNIGYIAAAGLVIYQLIFLHHHMYLEWDDAFYVNIANVAGFEDKIYWVYPEDGMYASFEVRYIFSLWPIFYAWLSGIIGVLPTIMAHTILPWLMIPLAYMVYGLIGTELFPDDDKLRGMFLALAIMMHLFMSGQHTAGLTFLSITPWVGKGLWATVLMPALFYWILRTYRDDTFANWFMLGLTGLAGSLLSSMGIMLMPVFSGLAIFFLSIKKKDLKYLLKGAAACVPCVILGIAYIVLPHIKLY